MAQLLVVWSKPEMKIAADRILANAVGKTYEQLRISRSQHKLLNVKKLELTISNSKPSA